MYGKVGHDAINVTTSDGVTSATTFAPKASFYGVQAFSKLTRASAVAFDGRLRGVESDGGGWTKAGTNGWVMRYSPSSSSSSSSSSGRAEGLLMGWVTGDASQCSAVPMEDRRDCGNMPEGAASQ